MSEHGSNTLAVTDETGAKEIPLSAAEVTKLYAEILTAIRTTDDTSFKLLGLVPLVSGIANAGLAFLGKSWFNPYTIVLLSILGASVTYCLFRWEQRNIQSCAHWWKKLELVERRLGFKELAGRPDAPIVNGRRWGKTEAETWIYSVAGVAWLVPIVTVVSQFLMSGNHK
jgi:hypothetical protein